MPNGRSHSQPASSSQQQNLPPLPRDLSTLKAEDIVAIADQAGRHFCHIKPTQLRNFFDHIVRLRTSYRLALVQKEDDLLEEKEREKLLGQLVLLKPKLAYAKGRFSGFEQFYTFMIHAIDGVRNSTQWQDALENFFALTEAVVAYHKFYGGKD
ncbi:MAG: type III-A CRISPR-associated protein Csm2 [Bacteroidota bacterium]|nr:type III-A CRISPR-associated protein Csm2 [Bacteroidota bacterium]